MIVAKTFYELNNQELYQILRLRSEVFVVEQDCVYQDLDNKDQISVHVFQKEKDEIVAYRTLPMTVKLFYLRIIITPQHAKKLAKALNDNISRFEDNFGSIKDYDNPKFQLNFGPTGKA